MKFPYKVTVSKSNGGSDIHVAITPQPISTKEAYLPLVTKRFQNIILQHTNTANTIIGRSRLKSALMEALLDFHNQGMIEPVKDGVK